MTRILVTATSHLETEQAAEIAKLWQRSAYLLNPDVDFYLLDCCSPFSPANVFPLWIETHVWPENVGALSRGQRDGAGRNLCRGFEIAIERHYDYVIHWETDFLFAKPVRPIVEKMRRTGVRVACQQAHPYAFSEWGISFFSVDYLRSIEFVRRYAWGQAQPWPIPEWRLEAMTQDEVFWLPHRGLRVDQTQGNGLAWLAGNPYFPPDWITHCDVPTARRFLELNKVILP